MRLGVSPTASAHRGFFSQRFWAFIFPHWSPGLSSMFCSQVLLPDISACKCGTAPSTSCHPPWSSRYQLASGPLCPGCLSQPILPACMNVFSLILWLSYFHTIQFSGSPCWLLFFFLICCCPSFGCARRPSVSTYTSILARSLFWIVYYTSFSPHWLN